MTINDKEVTSSKHPFEYHPGILSNKIAEVVGDVPVTSIVLMDTRIETGEMNETIATLASLNIPDTGLDKLVFRNFYYPLKECIS